MGDAFLEVFTLQALDHLLLGSIESFRKCLKHCVVDLILYHAQGARAQLDDDLTYAGDVIQSRTFRPFETYLIITAIYLILAVAARRVLLLLGRRLFVSGVR